MIKYSIDEFTMIFLPTHGDIDIEKWHIRFDDLSLQIADILRFKDIGFDRVLEGRVPRPYNSGYFYGNAYTCICYHNMIPTMGICLKFSASGLREYFLKYKNYFGKSIDVTEIIKLLSKSIKNYLCRLSRVDLDADLIDENVSVNELAAELNSKSIVIKDKRNYRNKSGINAVVNDGITNTIYIGSKGSKSRKYTRIYNKKIEQLNNTSPGYYSLAKSCKNWVRIELVLKQELAHQMTDFLINSSVDDLPGLVAKLISDNLRFWRGNTELEFSKKIFANATNNCGELLAISSRNYNLEKSYEYYLHGTSGLQSFLYKLRKVCGEKSAVKFLQKVYQYQIADFKPSVDLKKWVNYYQENKL